MSRETGSQAEIPYFDSYGFYNASGPLQFVLLEINVFTVSFRNVPILRKSPTKLQCDTFIGMLRRFGGTYRLRPQDGITAGQYSLFEFVTGVIMNVATFRDIAPCGPYVNRRFEGTYRLHIQGRNSATCNLLYAGCLLG